MKRLDRIIKLSASRPAANASAPAQLGNAPRLRPAAWLAALTLAVGACGGGGRELFEPTLPADAARITGANATDIASATFDSIEDLALSSPFKNGESEASNQVNLRQVSDWLRARVHPSYRTATRSEIQACDDGGSIRLDFNSTASSASGKAVFMNCGFFGFTVNGKMTFDITFNDTTGDYRDHFNGSLRYTFGADTLLIVFDIRDHGNENSGDFSSTFKFSVSGIPGGGFLVTTSTKVTGNFLDYFSGQLIVYGADNTRLRITIDNVNQATLDLDPGNGIFVFHATISLI